jgi:hypothetical protein
MRGKWIDVSPLGDYKNNKITTLTSTEYRDKPGEAGSDWAK